MWRRRLKSCGLYLAMGVVATLLIAWGSALVVDLSAILGRATVAFDGRAQWNVQVVTHPLGQRVHVRREAARAWGPEQALGPPDTAVVGDLPTAWASAAPDAQPEWLELTFPTPLVPVAIHVYESYNPGAISKATAYDAAGVPLVIPTARATQLPGAGSAVGVLTIPVPRNAPPTARVRLDINSPAVPGWNEIDAVALVDAAGTFHWAGGAQASSTYAPGSSTLASGTPATATRLADVIPAWTGLRELPRPPAAKFRIVEGRGWPLPALRADATHAGTTTVFPWRPIPAGLAVNTILFGAIAFALHALLGHLPRFFVESARIRRGCCLRCGYDLQFDFLPGCPECGWRRAEAIPGVSVAPRRAYDGRPIARARE